MPGAKAIGCQEENQNATDTTAPQQNPFNLHKTDVIEHPAEGGQHGAGINVKSAHNGSLFNKAKIELPVWGGTQVVARF
jgi:hypothetical protein